MPIENATLQQKKEFCGNVFDSLKKIKNKISSKKYSEFQHLLTLLLKENVVFNSDLTQYFNETETFKSRPTYLQEFDVKPMTIDEVITGDELAEMLYHMSTNARAKAYGKFPKNIGHIITDVEQLENVIRFLPAKRIEDLLKKKEMKDLICNSDDLNAITKKMFTDMQRESVHRAMQTTENYKSTIENQRDLKSQLATLRSEDVVKEANEASPTLKKI